MAAFIRGSLFGESSSKQGGATVSAGVARGTVVSTDQVMPMSPARSGARCLSDGRATMVGGSGSVFGDLPTSPRGSGRSNLRTLSDGRACRASGSVLGGEPTPPCSSIGLAVLRSCSDGRASVARGTVVECGSSTRSGSVFGGSNPGSSRCSSRGGSSRSGSLFCDGSVSPRDSSRESFSATSRVHLARAAVAERGSPGDEKKPSAGSETDQGAHEVKPPQKPAPPASRRRTMARRARYSLAPPKAGSTFKVAFARDAEEAIGLDIDIVDGVSAIIVGISGGAVHRWNEWRPELALRANDRIIEANGMSGNASAVAMKLKTESLWELVVQRPIELSISLPGSDSEDPTLGLCLRRARRSSALLVTSVGAGPMEE